MIARHRRITTHEVMNDLKGMALSPCCIRCSISHILPTFPSDSVEEETGQEEVAIHCEGVINPGRFRGFVRQAVRKSFISR